MKLETGNGSNCLASRGVGSRISSCSVGLRESLFAVQACTVSRLPGGAVYHQPLADIANESVCAFVV